MVRKHPILKGVGALGVRSAEALEPSARRASVGHHRDPRAPGRDHALPGQPPAHPPPGSATQHREGRGPSGGLDVDRRWLRRRVAPGARSVEAAGPEHDAVEAPVGGDHAPEVSDRLPMGAGLRPVRRGGGCVAGAVEEAAYRARLNAAGFEAIEIEPTRVYQVEDARQFLTAKGIDLDAIAPLVDGKVMSAFVRARKPGATN